MNAIRNELRQELHELKEALEELEDAIYFDKLVYSQLFRK